MICGVAGNTSRAVAMTPPAGSVFTSRCSWGASAEAAGRLAHRQQTQRMSNQHTEGTTLPDDRIKQPLMNFSDPFELPFGGKSFVKSFGTKFFGQCGPRFDNLCKRLM